MAGMAAENQGWFAYSVLLAVAAATALLPLTLQYAIRLFRKPSHLSSQLHSESAKSSVVASSTSLNTRYFTAVQVGALLILPVFLMIPLVNPASGRSVWSSLSLVTLCVTTGVALVYVNRKGDLRWIASARKQENQSLGKSHGEAP